MVEPLAHSIRAAEFAAIRSSVFQVGQRQGNGAALFCRSAGLLGMPEGVANDEHGFRLRWGLRC